MTVIDSGLGWAIFGAAFVLIFILLGILGEHMRQKRKLMRQELQQKERLMMLEKGLPLPEWDAVALDDNGNAISSAESYERRLQWFRLVSLAIGFLLAFSGLGMLLAFHLAYGNDWRDIATIGAIPLMAGIGLFLFYFLTRDMNQSG